MSDAKLSILSCRRDGSGMGSLLAFRPQAVAQLPLAPQGLQEHDPASSTWTVGMLRITQQNNAQAAKSYYAAPAEYYAAGEQEVMGEWGGKAAERLGLSGDIQQLHFSRLCDNFDPFSGEQLTARMRADRRVGYDFNFHSCKSASILYAITGDDAIPAAALEAAREVMECLESGVKVRVRKQGQYAERVTGNMVWMEALHLTARPVNGMIDPHVHVHCFVPNASWDYVEHQWKAIDVASVQENAPRWRAMFHRRFGQKLEKLGYAVAWKGDGFEIEGIERPTIDKFSLRTAHINHTAQKRGITDARDKDRLGAWTREGKRKDVPLPQLRAGWRERLTDEERQTIAKAALKRRHRMPSDAARSSSRQGATIDRLRAQASIAGPELDAWERERRDYLQRLPRRQKASAISAERAR